MGSINFKLLFDALPGPHLVVEINDPTFTIAYENEEHARIALTTVDKNIGCPLFEAFPDTSEKFLRTGQSDLANSLRTVIKTGKPDSMPALHYDLIDETGKQVERWWRATHYPVFDESGKLAFIYQATNDITNEMQTAEELQMAQGQLGTALEAGLVSTWYWNIDSDKVVGDRNLGKHFGITAEEAASGLPLETFLKSIHKDDIQRVTESIKNTSEHGVVYEEEYRTIDSKGNTYWVIARGKKFKNKDGGYLAGTLIDITERRKAQAENVKLRAINESKDEFVSLASHQLRTPATGVKQYVGMVLEGYAGEITDLQRDMLEKANMSNDRQLQIIDDLLNVAKADSGRIQVNKTRTNVAQLISQIVEDQQLDFKERNQKLLFVTPDKDIDALLDQDTIRMALGNLIDNASKYSKQNTTVKVTATATKSDLTLSVIDQGVGINANDLAKLFKKFSRVDNEMSIEVGGSGLGLYWSKKVAELHGGNILVEPNKPQGTIFSITIPLR